MLQLSQLRDVQNSSTRRETKYPGQLALHPRVLIEGIEKVYIGIKQEMVAFEYVTLEVVIMAFFWAN